MDVHCSSCDEPWDTYHLKFDAIDETDLNEEEAEAWRKLPPAQKLNARLREKFAAAGWTFGASVINVRRCPCCPKDAKLNGEADAAKSAMEPLFGDDEDGLAAMYEDFGL